jgi:Transposase DDE domain
MRSVNASIGSTCSVWNLRIPWFDASVLSEFRCRLADSGNAEQLIFQRLLDLLAEADLIGPGGSRRTDSTKVLAQVRALDRLEMVGETLRAGLEAAAACAPDWLRSIAAPEWFTRYGPRVDGYRLPKGASERVALAEQIGRDGVSLYAASRLPGAPECVKTLPALEALRAIWLQKYYQDEHGLHWRERERHGRPPGALLILSPYDLDVRWSTKRGQDWIGYKAQISEACDDLLPHIITYVAAVPATESDVDTIEPLHEKLAATRCRPAEHFVDSGYISAGHILAARASNIELVGPVQPNRRRHTRGADAFDTDEFVIDRETLTASRPQGHDSVWTDFGRDRNDNPVTAFHFSRTDCTACPQRARCTKAKANGRTLTVRPREERELLIEQRRIQQTDAWKTRYAKRSGAEGTISQATRSFGLRACRFRGHAKSAVQHVLVATAINLARLDAWLCGRPLGETRVSHLTALAPDT